MRSSFKTILACSAVIAACGLAIAQQGDAKKPPANTAPAKPEAAKPPAPKDAKPAAPAMDPKMMEAMAAMAKAGMPGPEHKKLEPMVGQFDVICKFGPGGEMTAKGAALNKWIFDGRFVEMTFQGDMMGDVFHGMGFMGYNNMTKQYESFWIDSTATGMMMTTGKTADGKTFTWTGESDDPMSGEHVKLRHVNKIVDANTYVFEMYKTGKDGKEVREGELTFKRTGAAKPEAAKPAAPAGNTAPAAPGKK